MRDYNVLFSFYDEVWGAFEDTAYPVSAESPFAAREKAWAICAADKESPLRSNIKQYAVTWEPNPLDIGDYFYAYAADIKQSLGSLMNVTIPNDEILGFKRNEILRSERNSFLSSLYTVGEIASDLYGAKGILPPSIYEELHYAEKLYEHICENHYDNKADHLWEMIKKAKAWDYGAIYALRDLFQNGYTTLCGNTERFREQFGKGGLYPVHNNLDDWDGIYIVIRHSIRSQIPVFESN
ncbi:MAG: hypothetical protein ACRDBO_17560 [Lachnospiraceae bacterium]